MALRIPDGSGGTKLVLDTSAVIFGLQFFSASVGVPSSIGSRDCNVRITTVLRCMVEAGSYFVRAGFATCQTPA